MIMIHLSWKEASQEIGGRMENSLNLAIDQLDNLAGDSRRVNIFIESNNLLSGLSRMINNKGIQYTDMISIRDFSAFINSIVNSENRTDSIYLYLPNTLNRVYTSSQNFVFLENLTDQDWVEMLQKEEKQQWITCRDKTDYNFESPKQTLTIFYKFRNFKGGTAVNYSAADINRLFDSILFYKNQSVLVIDQEGNILIHNESLSSGETDVLMQAIMAQHDDSSSLPGKENQYLIAQTEYPEYHLSVVTAIPRKAVFQTALQSIRLTLFITLMTIVITVILAYILSLNSYRQLNQVAILLDSAESGTPLPQVRENNKDMYSQILQNIIRIFLQNNYLQVQLSERKYKLQAAQLQALQYQINPHFLFNTLQTINYEILSLSGGRQTHANHMVENLSDIMRFSLGPTDNFVPLAQELEYCRKYLEIQQTRYNNRFQIIWDIDERLLDTPILRLLIQPAAENSISHGFKYKEGNGRIKINVRRKKETMEIRICDDGAGIPRQKLRDIRRKLYEKELEYTADHIGLQNCSLRLRLAYSESGTLHIYSKENLGTVVVLQIPLN